MTKRIPYARFRRYAARHCQTLSRFCRPQHKESVREYTVNVAEFLADPVFPPWYVNRKHSKLVPWNSKEAEPVSFYEIIWRGLVPFPHVIPKSATALVLHCKGCNRRVVIDGNHRILRLMEGGMKGRLRVLELSGYWDPKTPDMSVVCGC